MALSIPFLITFQIYSIPLVGSDICGFIGNTTEELCSRWTALGAFYPFSRNHNDINAMSQEPYLWDSVTVAARKYLGMRYQLLGLYYTLFHQASLLGDPVVRALSFEFPGDRQTHTLDTQFLIGSSLLVSPVLAEGSATTMAYFPAGLWYDFHTYACVTTQGAGQWIEIQTPIDTIGVHVRGGSVLPLFEAPELTASGTHANSDYSLLVALDATGNASGELYHDDGESLKVTDSVSARYVVANQRLEAHAVRQGSQTSAYPNIASVKVLGLSRAPKEVLLDDVAAKFKFIDNVLVVTAAGNGLGITGIDGNFSLRWVSDEELIDLVLDQGSGLDTTDGSEPKKTPKPEHGVWDIQSAAQQQTLFVLLAGVCMFQAVFLITRTWRSRDPQSKPQTDKVLLV